VKPRAALGVLAAAAVADALLLRWVGVTWGEQLVFAAVVALWALAGAALVPAAVDRLTLAVTATAAGMSVHMALAFAACQDAVARALGIPDARAAATLSFVLLLPLAVRGTARLRRTAPGRWTETPGAAVLIFGAASLVACLTAFGWVDPQSAGEGLEHVRERVREGRSLLAGPAPEWGSPQDRGAHAFGWMHERTFPRAFARREFRHQGVEVTLVSVLFLGGPHSPARAVAGTKPLSLLWLLLLALVLHAMARDVAGASGRAAALAGLGGLLFAALNPSAFVAPVTSYRIAPIAGSLYHNLTQQASLAAGFAGLYLAALGLARGGRRAFAAGCLLLGISVFYKPSLFSVAAPVVVGVALWAARRAGVRTVAPGLALLGGAAAFWYGYPRLTHLGRLGVSGRVAFMDYQRNTDLFLPLPGDAATVLQVLVLSYAVFVPTALAGFRRPRAAGATWAPDAGRALILLVGLAGLLSGHLMAERGSWGGSGRFMFGYGAGYLLLLPLLVRWIERLPSRPWRAVAWTLYAAHLLSGAWNLWVFAYYGRI
jgi:hypothetical protein